VDGAGEIIVSVVIDVDKRLGSGAEVAVKLICVSGAASQVTIKK
jgi:hypothetical protein